MLASAGDGGGSNTRRRHFRILALDEDQYTDFLSIALKQTKAGPRSSGTAFLVWIFFYYFETQFIPSCVRMTGVNTAISADLKKSSSERTILKSKSTSAVAPFFKTVVYPPISKWVSPMPDIPRDNAAGIVDGRPSEREKSTF